MTKLLMNRPATIYLECITQGAPGRVITRQCLSLHYLIKFKPLLESVVSPLSCSRTSGSVFAHKPLTTLLLNIDGVITPFPLQSILLWLHVLEIHGSLCVPWIRVEATSHLGIVQTGGRDGPEGRQHGKKKHNEQGRRLKKTYLITHKSMLHEELMVAYDGYRCCHFFPILMAECLAGTVMSWRDDWWKVVHGVKNEDSSLKNACIPREQTVLFDQDVHGRTAPSSLDSDFGRQ